MLIYFLFSNYRHHHPLKLNFISSTLTSSRPSMVRPWLLLSGRNQKSKKKGWISYFWAFSHDFLVSWLLLPIDHYCRPSSATPHCSSSVLRSLATTPFLPYSTKEGKKKEKKKKKGKKRKEEREVVSLLSLLYLFFFSLRFLSLISLSLSM